MSAAFPVNDVCGPGSNLTGSPLTLSNGSLAANGASCTFTVALTLPLDALPGRFTNTTSNLTGTISGTPKSAFNKGGPVTVPPAVADLDVVAIVFNKAFIDAPVTAGDTTTLEFSLNNPSTVDAINIRFTDDLDAVLPGLAAVDLPKSNVCGASSVVSGASVIDFSGGSLLAGASCTFVVQLWVPINTTGFNFDNITSPISADFAGLTVSGNPASAANAPLVVLGFPTIPVPAMGWVGMLALMLMLVLVVGWRRGRRVRGHS